MKTCFVVATAILLTGLFSATGNPDANKELRERLRGTQWQWDGGGGEVVTFKADGYIEHEGWTESGLLTRWDVIDRRTVLLRIERGRDRDRYAVLTFNDDMTSYDGYNFHGCKKLAASRRLP